eukprot:TRINITY_DN2035_c0_g1_i5.p1 TRINITY_DN2035_c0_g1~~TRINITY_DN2035_c0_g1_i5.p1  ORF type:complete len:177 (+),score=29.58 TRINITY_DN2035_c0_g1_i5:169-699(+)
MMLGFLKDTVAVFSFFLVVGCILLSVGTFVWLKFCYYPGGLKRNQVMDIGELPMYDLSGGKDGDPNYDHETESYYDDGGYGHEESSHDWQGSQAGMDDGTSGGYDYEEEPSPSVMSEMPVRRQVQTPMSVASPMHRTMMRAVKTSSVGSSIRDDVSESAYAYTPSSVRRSVQMMEL